MDLEGLLVGTRVDLATDRSPPVPLELQNLQKDHGAIEVDTTSFFSRSYIILLDPYLKELMIPVKTTITSGGKVSVVVIVVVVVIFVVDDAPSVDGRTTRVL